MILAFLALVEGKAYMIRLCGEYTIVTVFADA